MSAVPLVSGYVPPPVPLKVAVAVSPYPLHVAVIFAVVVSFAAATV